MNKLFDPATYKDAYVIKKGPDTLFVDGVKGSSLSLCFGRGIKGWEPWVKVLGVMTNVPDSPQLVLYDGPPVAAVLECWAALEKMADLQRLEAEAELLTEMWEIVDEWEHPDEQPGEGSSGEERPV